ncbi:MAG: hypothetical protein HY308_11385 [Gammaproteobacteria bacterium]|nr:hypothetical protein [Gammaproteobacteria bacterium]
MGGKLVDICQRRARLVARAAIQRDELARVTQSWRAPLSLADRGMAVVQTLRRYPLAIGLVTAVLVRMVFKKRSGWMKRWVMSRICRSILD